MTAASPPAPQTVRDLFRERAQDEGVGLRSFRFRERGRESVLAT